jgi:transposase
MFRKTSPQLSLFDVKNVFPGALSKDDWCYLYREQVYPFIDEEIFRELYPGGTGRPNTSVKKAVSVLIFMDMERHTWRGAEFLQTRRIDWLIATKTPIGEDPIDHTTLFKFFLRMERSGAARKLFEKLTLRFIEACGTSTKKQRTDSFFMHGWLQILSRYGLFKETLRVFLQNLRKQKPGLYEDISKGLSRSYLDKEFDLTEKDHEKAQREVKRMAQDLYAVYTAFDKHHQVNRYESFKTLATIFRQQCEVVENPEKTVCEVVIREKPVGDEIISSPHNTDARYVKKGKQAVCGQKGFLTETCDKNNKTRFITDAAVTSATTADVKELPAIQERLEEGKMKPEEHYADAGFVNGQTIVDSHDKGIELEGPSSGRSQSFEKYQDKDRPFDTADFEVRVDEETKEVSVLSCPGKQAPVDHVRSEKTGKTLVHFDASVCKECTANARCPVKIGVGVATLTIDEASYVGAARHHRYMENTDYRKRCAIRAGVEATVSEMVRAHGVRRSRHRTEGRTRVRVIFAALACNVKRFIRHGILHGYIVSAHAITSPSAAVSVAQKAFRSFFLHGLSFIYVSGRKSLHFSIFKTKLTVSACFRF